MKSNNVNKSATIETPISEVDSGTASPSEAVQPITVDNTPDASAKPILERPAVKAGKIKIDLERLNETLHRASCLAGNMAAIALRNEIGRVAKDMSGGGTLVATVSCIPDLKAKGLLGETDSKEGKELVAKKIKAVQALNRFIDSMTDLDLCKRS